MAVYGLTHMTGWIDGLLVFLLFRDALGISRAIHRLVTFSEALQLQRSMEANKARYTFRLLVLFSSPFSVSLARHLGCYVASLRFDCLVHSSFLEASASLRYSPRRLMGRWTYHTQVWDGISFFLFRGHILPARRHCLPCCVCLRGGGFLSLYVICLHACIGMMDE